MQINGMKAERFKYNKTKIQAKNHEYIFVSEFILKFTKEFSSNKNRMCTKNK